MHGKPTGLVKMTLLIDDTVIGTWAPSQHSGNTFCLRQVRQGHPQRSAGRPAHAQRHRPVQGRLPACGRDPDPPGPAVQRPATGPRFAGGHHVRGPRDRRREAQAGKRRQARRYRAAPAEHPGPARGRLPLHRRPGDRPLEEADPERLPVGLVPQLRSRRHGRHGSIHHARPAAADRVSRRSTAPTCRRSCPIQRCGVEDLYLEQTENLWITQRALQPRLELLGPRRDGQEVRPVPGLRLGRPSGARSATASSTTPGSRAAAARPTPAGTAAGTA